MRTMKESPSPCRQAIPKAVLLGDNAALPIADGKILFKAHEHSKSPCSVIKLSK